MSRPLLLILALLVVARPFLRGRAVGLFLKGRGSAAEVEAARARWRSRAELIPSLSDPEGRVVRVEGLTRG